MAPVQPVHRYLAGDIDRDEWLALAVRPLGAEDLAFIDWLVDDALREAGLLR